MGTAIPKPNILCNYVTEEFNNYMQQDAHEFLNFLINRINEIILRKYFIYNISITLDLKTSTSVGCLDTPSPNNYPYSWCIS